MKYKCYYCGEVRRFGMIKAIELTSNGRIPVNICKKCFNDDKRRFKYMFG